MTRVYRIAAGLVGAAILLPLIGSGCQQSAGRSAGAGSPTGAEYLLDAEPEGAQSIVDARAVLDMRQEPTDIVIVGCVSGLSQPTWDPDRAAFMVADLTLANASEAAQAEHDETPKHDADNCPFCRVKKKKELSGLALVQVVEPDGSIPPVDARQLLGLQEGRTIVVRGKGEIDKLGTFVVRTNGIFVRP